MLPTSGQRGSVADLILKYSDLIHILCLVLCVLQPEDSFSLTITWTPTEEGGIRELIIFNASGVVKHQAVLLGRAEAPKKKKVSQTRVTNDHNCELIYDLNLLFCLIITSTNM